MRPAYITTISWAISEITAEVVADELHRHADLVLQFGHQVEDLRLDRHVERRGRFVGDQQRGAAGQRHGDHHALAHAARELVRIGVGPLARPRECRPRRAVRPPRSPAGRQPSAVCSTITSAICRPTGITGFSAVIGSWNTIAMRSPRSSRHVAGGARQFAPLEADRAARRALAPAPGPSAPARSLTCRSRVHRRRRACGPDAGRSRCLRPPRARRRARGSAPSARAPTAAVRSR